VAKGTVFCHFDTKEELVSAVVCGQLEALGSAALGLLAAPDAEAALLEFLTVAADAGPPLAMTPEGLAGRVALY
jgi:AcrR family transcriptional regulator